MTRIDYFCSNLMAFCLLSVLFVNGIVINSTDDTGSLKILVVDKEDNPISGATILLWNSTWNGLVDRSFTDLNGEATFEGLQPGTYIVDVYYDPSKQKWPPSETSIGYDTVEIKKNYEKFEYLRTNYPAPLVEQSWFLAALPGLLSIAGVLAGVLITYGLTIVREKRAKKEKRQTTLRLFSSELRNLKETIKNQYPTFKPGDFPLEILFYDRLPLEHLSTFRPEEIYSLTEGYQKIRKFSRLLAGPGIRRAPTKEEIETMVDEINRLLSKLKEWKKSF